MAARLTAASRTAEKQLVDYSMTKGADTPMKRPAQPEEIAPAYVFLASPQCSSYITGEVLPIIGGYSPALMMNCRCGQPSTGWSGKALPRPDRR